MEEGLEGTTPRGVMGCLRDGLIREPGEFRVEGLTYNRVRGIQRRGVEKTFVEGLARKVGCQWEERDRKEN